MRIKKGMSLLVVMKMAIVNSYDTNDNISNDINDNINNKIKDNINNIKE